MTYTVYHLACTAEDSDLLLALLADAGFDSFEETDTGLDAYALSEDDQSSIEVLEELKARYSFTYTSEELPDRNWNEEWESGFSPIRIDDRLLIRASFHPPEPSMRREIVIDPKMAFGTGHHATTHMMCERLLEHFAGHHPTPTHVLDYGCGTGVLAILAKQLGAGRVAAVDIELPAYESTLENAATNGVELEEVVHGVLSDVPVGKPYDLVLANINRNVLLETGEALYQRLSAGGTVYMSGVLAADEQLLISHLEQLGFRHRATYAREDWRAFDFTRD
ncbi:50S ribosomal protein L11 methyltransferase [Lewinella sp. JB7]|uniref:50S ribosomal protein L11 methyltransferase n=1 Tax=Lewinella sp. JB7 TaxID=2962887 RepID=UPI0020C9FFEC|nr:50S ribosomal protein L11 methyltransferase [Lewinella sp. JB7]MCP9235199.1 50S ribosomal protein L11 methyltransferase [Lewinella sp. JB7]